MDSVVWFHTVAALLAIPGGLVVLLRRKGDRRHRRWGQAFLVLMLVANLSSFWIYELTGRATMFHFLAVVSVLTFAAGFASARWRWPKGGWRQSHYYFMLYGYAGLVSASINELFAHVPALRAILGGNFTPASFTALNMFVVFGTTTMLVRRDAARRFAVSASAAAKG